MHAALAQTRMRTCMHTRTPIRTHTHTHKCLSDLILFDCDAQSKVSETLPIYKIEIGNLGCDHTILLLIGEMYSILSFHII